MAAPTPKDLSHYYSLVVQRTQVSEVKKLYKYYTIPGVANLSGGLPNSSYFPYDTLEAQVAPPDRFQPSTTSNVKPQTTSRTKDVKLKQTAGSHITVPHDSTEVDLTRKIDVTTALQYGTSKGYPPVQQWVQQFATTMHPDVPYEGGASTILTLGCTDGLAKALHMFSEIWDDRKDWVRNRQGILVESFTFMNSVQAMKPRGLNIVPVEVDVEGLLTDGPGGLKDVLENWDRTKGKLPHLLYTIPTGQNPTGGVLSLERRKQVYQLCSKYDIVIIEDDPYWFLQYPSAMELSATYHGQAITEQVDKADTNQKKVSSGYAFLDSLVPSYLSVDTDGRVVRLDTFSKTIAPGCRMGWITAQPNITDKIGTFTDILTQEPSGFVQSMVAELLIGQQTLTTNPNTNGGVAEQNWHTAGWVRWMEGLRGVYERRMHTLVKILMDNRFKINVRPVGLSDQASRSRPDDFEVVTKTAVYDFNIPMGGMFLWLRMAFESHPLFNDPKVTLMSLSNAFWIFMTSDKYKIIIGPGTIFSPTTKIREERGYYYFRMCFAAVSEEVLETSAHKVAQAAQDFFDIDDPQQIEDLIGDDAAEVLRANMNNLAFMSPMMC